MAKNPGRVIERMEQVLNGWEATDPGRVIAGVSLEEYRADVEAVRQAQALVERKRTEWDNAQTDRDKLIEAKLERMQRVVNGVIGDPELGPDSKMYEAMGYVRKSARKSGLTRKNKDAAPPTEGPKLQAHSA
ncbi:hypothetical protein Mterra_04058 [Calidithermus terrae]|uniref:Uncharacterized protein n=1 Tax=Calidithermus terrae TaxID=1408545 RepID=A0A399DXE2_9DEIN|nr:MULTISPECIES: hypothetical protein [Calidithermus]RIH74660.1 hypothetical protein Mterra_04058 [Calidithermus terrae]